MKLKIYPRSLKQLFLLWLATLLFALQVSNPSIAGQKTLLQLGDDALDHENYGEAITEYSEEIKLNPENAGAYLGRGKAYFLKKDGVDHAIPDFTRAIELNPSDAEVYYFLGCALNLKEMKDKAISNFTKAIQLKPNYGEAYLVRGEMLSSQGKYDQAIQDLNMAIKFNKKYWLGGAYYARGQAYVFKKDSKQAARDFKKAASLEPDNDVFKDTLRTYSREN